MSLSDISIKNPVFAVMLTAAMIVFGYLGYQELGISQFPEIDFPVVNVTTYRDVAAPETMDFDVTDIIEDAISGIEGIDYVQSQSLEGVSVVTVYFQLNRDVDVAMLDVQNAVSAAANRLPSDIDPPIVSKVNFNKFPVIWLSVHGQRPLAEINDFVNTRLKQKVETVPGCGGVMYGGLRARTMRVWLDGQKLSAANLDALDVMQAMRAEHAEKPAGYIQGGRREFNVRTMGEARTAREFQQLPILNHQGQVIKLGDVAVVEDGMADRRSFSRFNREPNVGMGVMRAKGANVVAVCDEVKKRLPELRRSLQQELGPDVDISISTDYSLFIKADIQEMQQSMFLGILLTAVVTFLFLGSVGTTLNVCVAIPASLVGTFVAMRLFGFTLNFMTLLALSLSVGVVVDDAIMVLENIYRRREHGEDKTTAARRGAREISFAATAATFSIAAIFIPVAFMKGSIGLFFFQFGITVTVAVALSLVISLTITPMLCAAFLSVRKLKRPWPRSLSGHLGPVFTFFIRVHWLFDRWVLEPIFVAPVNKLMSAMCRWYAWTLHHALRHTWWVLPASVLLAATALIFAYGLSIPLPGFLADASYNFRPGAKLEKRSQPGFEIHPVGRELVPSEDQNRFLVNVICPVGSSIDYVDEMMARGEEVLAGFKDPASGRDIFAGFFAAVSIRPGQLISEGILFVRLIPARERSLTQLEIIAELRKRLAAVPGMRATVLDLSVQGFTASRGYPVDFAIQGPDWDTVTKFSERIRQRMAESRLVTDVNSDYRPGMPEVHVLPDRKKAAVLGVPIQRLAFALNVAFGGMRNGRFTDDERRYDVRLRYLRGQRSSPDQLAELFVKTDTGKLVPLRDVTTTKLVSTLPVIHRYNHLRKVELTANMASGVDQGEAVASCLQMAHEIREEMGLPPSYRIVQLGNAQAMKQTIDSLWWGMALGFVVAAMILAVQFNSFVHPFTVLVAVPFGVTGALAMLWCTGDTLNMMSMIGLILLAGLVKKNSIILVDYISLLRSQGQPLREAVLTACPIRLRPILMTSLATIASALPLAIGFGPGAETRAPLARSIIGGILLSTLVTLIIVPLFYVLFDRMGSSLYRLSRRPERHATAAEAELPRPSRNGTVHPGPHRPQPRILEPALEVRPEIAG